MIRRLPRWTWLLLAACLGLVLGAAWPPPPIPKARAESSDWALPGNEVLKRVSMDEVKRALQGLRWDAGGADASGPRAWRLAGFVNVPPTSVLIQSTDPQGKLKAQHFKPGDSLPDQGLLVSVDGETITVELEGCRSVYQLHRKKPIDQQGCGEEAAEADSRTSQ